MDHLLGVLFGIPCDGLGHEQGREVHLQNRLHAVEAESFTAFVADNVRHAPGITGFVRIGGCAVVHGEIDLGRVVGYFVIWS